MNTNKLIIQGIPASTGIATGMVVMLEQLLAGMNENTTEPIILVGEMIPPDVTQLSNKICGLVTDEGGSLCHGAILAREMGIPGVVGTRKATEVLKTGMKITVDGEKGYVFISK